MTYTHRARRIIRGQYGPIDLDAFAAYEAKNEASNEQYDAMPIATGHILLWRAECRGCGKYTEALDQTCNACKGET